MSDDPVLDYLLRDDDPEYRDDPGYRAAMKKTMAYEVTALSFQLHAAVEEGIASLPRWAQPAVRGYQRMYQRWINPVGHRIAAWSHALGYRSGRGLT